ncbi:Mycothiol acetyltransferase [compost metagenome]|uniref:GNAT family N-acetyltransferase n=1 Tax=Paenibacillus rhizolycopersici TaxID=2780073 RepID=A0ABS2HDV1_9BACL|nr:MULTISPECIES: GNAT family N-acetyltransferase [Paenibacillus]MBM6998070.1 GNAT family N-acetyltransferase [Paenibacillus rhizolycopersici]GIP50921.1 N-acetyltransferase [Paenibacillus sp. J53TS2]
MDQAKSTFRIVPMEEPHGAEICTWRYDSPYDIYSWLPWDQMKALDVEFGNPAIRAEQYVSVLNEAGELAGFAQYFPMEGVTRLGIGMKPDLCGHGLGKLFVRTIVEEARHRKPDNQIDLEVLTWNTRAIRAYQKAGFVITDLYEKMTPGGVSKPFYCMVHKGLPE